MSPRYLLLLGRDTWTRAELLRQLSQRAGLATAYANGSFAVAANQACPCLPVDDSGCILGWLFARGELARPVTSLSAYECTTVAVNGGRALLSTYWGGYVAAISRAGSVQVLRDPSGTFPCYYARLADCDIFASDAEILAASGVPVDLDLEEVGRQLYRAFVPSPATALRGIRELLPGSALQLPGRAEHQQLVWSPWDHVASERGQDDKSAERLSRTIRHCVRAWAAARGRLLLSVSGGLDSSIIAACLAEHGQETVCLTMFADDPAGDERIFARALCGHLGLRLIERPYRLQDIKIAEPLGAHLPRPRDRTQANAYERVHLEVAAEIGADAFMTGNGGDNVFGYSQSAAPVADHYLSEGLGHGLVRSLLDVCEQTGCSIFDAARQAWRLARSSPVHRVRPNPLFLHPDFLAGLGEAELQHPWLDAPPGSLPGKAAHVSAILRVQPNLEASRGYHLPVLTPLMSQPIIEACLAIPTWKWREGGRDRAVARRAFARDLPAAVRDRRVKGTPSRFAARLLDHFRAPIRERLLGGRLATHQIIDQRAVERQLLGDRPVPDLERVRILELVNVEAWLDHWAMRGNAPEETETHVKSAAHDHRPSSTGPIP